MKRIFVIIGILSLLVLGLFGYKKYTDSNIKLDIVELKEDEVKNGLAIMVEQGNGTYQESDTYPTGNYIFSKDKSGCIDKNGKAIANSISYSNRTVTFRTNGSAYCYVYFDIVPIIADIIVDSTGQTSGDGTVINENGYRYSGVDPNNYIEFNNETWRIIGIVDDYVKIIRNELLGEFRWDYKYGAVGSSTSVSSSNDWTDSQLMMMLNPKEYLKTGYTISNNLVYDSDGDIIYSNMGSYYNRTSGYVPAYITSGATSYGGALIDFSSTGLTEEARNMVQENTWYLADPFTASGLPNEYYKNEKKASNIYTNRLATWTGKIGLMYFSDYYYANNIYYNNPSSSNDSCANNWMCIGSTEWSLSAISANSYFVRYTMSSGDYASDYASDEHGVRPTLYLKPGITVTGEGTTDSKYQIVS